MSDTPNTPADAASPSPADQPRSWRRHRIGIAVGVAGALLFGLVVWALVDGDGSSRAAGERTTDTSATDEEPEQTTSETTTPATTDQTTTTPAAPTTGGGTGVGDSFADGQWTVGSDLQPGRYIATGIAGNGCDWARLAGTTGDEVIAAEQDVAGQAIVDIPASDTAFRSNGCGTWTLYTPPDPPPQATVDHGDWVVGEQIQPGTYLVARTATCHWTRATGFGHTTDEVIQTEASALSLEGPLHTQLTAGERFTTQGCATWQPSNRPPAREDASICFTGP